MPLFLPLLLQAQAIDAPALLKPVGKWNVDYGPKSCTLSRSFGDSTRGVTLGLRPATLGGAIVILLDAPDDMRDLPRGGKATLQIQPNARAVTANYTLLPESGQTRPTPHIFIERQTLSSWIDVERLSIALGKSSPITFDLGPMAGGINAVEKCQDDLLRTWQIDPAERANVSTTATVKSDLGEIFLPSELPRAALGSNLRRVEMLFTVGSNGRVTECRIWETSTDASIDANTCATAKTRLRYNPARDNADHPIVSHVVLGVEWRRAN